MNSSSALCFSLHTAYSQSPTQALHRLHVCHPHSPIVVVLDLVSIPPQASGSTSLLTATLMQPSLPEPWEDVASTTQYSSSPGVATLWFTELEDQCSQTVKDILLHSRRPSTRKTYMQKCKSAFLSGVRGLRENHGCPH